MPNIKCFCWIFSNFWVFHHFGGGGRIWWTKTKSKYSTTYIIYIYIYIYAMQEVEYLLLFFVHQILPAPPKWWNTQKLLMYISWNLRWQLSWNFMQIETQLNNESSEISKNLFFLADSYLAGFQSQQVNKISVWLKKLKIFTKVSWIVLLPLKIKKKEFFKNITENLHFLNTNTESNKDRSLLCKIYYL